MLLTYFLIAALPDVLFNIGNIAAWACCVGASFGWDERTAPAILLIMMTSVMVLLSDASCSDFEFGATRFVILLFMTLVCFSGNVRGLGWLAQLEIAVQPCPTNHEM